MCHLGLELESASELFEIRWHQLLLYRAVILPCRLKLHPVVLEHNVVGSDPHQRPPPTNARFAIVKSYISKKCSIQKSILRNNYTWQKFIELVLYRTLLLLLIQIIEIYIYLIFVELLQKIFKL